MPTQFASDPKKTVKTSDLGKTVTNKGNGGAMNDAAKKVKDKYMKDKC